ncbi:MAG: amino acid racemase [Anaerolineales bacterium]|nr:amino acid racemase [Anaerolineales bacterium]
MKTVGMIGGIAPESTVQFYRLLIAAYRERQQDGSYPLILINSIDMKAMLDLVGTNNLIGLTTYLASETEKLARAGADFALFASNTPHIVFDDVQRQTSINLLSIVKATCDSARGLGLKRVGLLGTRFTMQGQFYADVFSQQGIRVVVPNPEEQEYVHNKYMSELVAGIFLPETRDKVLAIANRLQEQDKIDGLVFGGTELPLLFRDLEESAIPFLDTTKIHVEAALEQMLS